MPAPTALLSKESSVPVDHQIQSSSPGDDDFILDMDVTPPFQSIPDTNQPAASTVHIQTRKVNIPPHRFSPIKTMWPKIYAPLVEHLQLQVRMNLKNKAVELRNSQFTTEPGALQKGEDFIRAITYGFDVDDAIALLRLDDLYMEVFEIKDIKTLQGDHLARAIGRCVGKDGRTRNAIENTTRTRIVVAGPKIHILGGFNDLKMAREAIVSLVLGARPSKVYQDLRCIAAKRKMRV
jgi:RNA-binding protein PNO1